MILRDATSEDEVALASFDLGADRSPWLDEVAEIAAGPVGWRDDPDRRNLDRQVVVAEVGGEIMAVAAHDCVEHERLGPKAEHCYLMVVAVRADHWRSGSARMPTESVFVAIQTDGVQTVRWLVHPRNDPSIAFSRSAFPEADETYPLEDRPYAAFLLSL